MTSEMAFECLLVSRDPGVVRVMNRLLDNLSIVTNIYLSGSRAFDHVSEGGADLVIIDWEEDSADFLHRVRTVRGWHKPTVLAVSQRDYLVRGADLVVCKPVTPEAGAKSLKAAYSRMLYDHRRHTRHAVMRAVRATNDKGESMDLMVTDIGDGGIGIRTKHQFNLGETICFRLLLPDTDKAIFLQACVKWTREYGAAGCEFVRITPGDLNLLHDWLSIKNQVKKPLVEI